MCGYLVLVYSPVCVWGDYWNQHLHVRSVGGKSICHGWCCVQWQPSWWMFWDSRDRQARTLHRGSKLILWGAESHVPSGAGRCRGSLHFTSTSNASNQKCSLQLGFGAVAQAWHHGRAGQEGNAHTKPLVPSSRVWLLHCFPLRSTGYGSVGACILWGSGVVEEELQPCSWPHVKPQDFPLILNSVYLMQKSTEDMALESCSWEGWLELVGEGLPWWKPLVWLISTVWTYPIPQFWEVHVLPVRSGS